MLKAGDILYIPQHWWHHVRSFDCPNIAISLWFHPFAEKEDDKNLEMEDETDDVSQDTFKYTNKLNYSWLAIHV